MSIGAGSVKSVSISVGIATGLYGISFGALSVAAGFSIWQTLILSLVMFSGGSQFAFVAVFATGGISALPSAITTAWALGIRNGFYALTLAPTIGPKGLWKILAAQFTIDESTAVSTSRSSVADRKLGFWLTGASVFVFWNLATFAGALLGNAISDPKVFGLDAAAATALFALVWPRLNHSRPIAIASASIAVSVIAATFTPAGVPVLLAAMAGVITGVVWTGAKK